MRLPKIVIRLVLLLWLGAILTACSHYAARVAPNVDLLLRKKLWVENNLADNHRIEILLVQVLRERGIDVESGPPTLQPFGVDAVLRYQDHWNWDFTDHMVALALEVRDPKTGKSIAFADYVAAASVTSQPIDIVRKLVDRLYSIKPAKPTKV